MKLLVILFIFNVCRPRINVKKLYLEKKQEKQAKISPAAGEIFFSLRFLTFRNSFKLVQTAFCSGSITFLENILVPN